MIADTLERCAPDVCICYLYACAQPAGVGKTCIAWRFVHETFADSDGPTIG